MEDVDVVDDADANGDVVEKDDAELCYEKHTGIIKNNIYYVVLANVVSFNFIHS